MRYVRKCRVSYNFGSLEVVLNFCGINQNKVNLYLYCKYFDYFFQFIDEDIIDVSIDLEEEVFEGELEVEFFKDGVFKMFKEKFKLISVNNYQIL